MKKRWKLFAAIFIITKVSPFPLGFTRSSKREAKASGGKSSSWWKLLFIRFIRSWAAQLCEWVKEMNFSFHSRYTIHTAIHKICIMNTETEHGTKKSSFERWRHWRLLFSLEGFVTQRERAAQPGEQKLFLFSCSHSIEFWKSEKNVFLFWTKIYDIKKSNKHKSTKHLSSTTNLSRYFQWSGLWGGKMR